MQTLILKKVEMIVLMADELHTIRQSLTESYKGKRTFIMIKRSPNQEDITSKMCMQFLYGQ